MRKLSLEDVVKAARIIKKANVRQEIREIFQRYSDGVKLSIKEYIPVKKGDSKKDQEEYERQLEVYGQQLAMAKSESLFSLGMDIIMMITDAAADEAVEGMIYDLIAGPAEKTADEIRNQSLEALGEDIVKIAKENDLKNFFDVVNRLAET